MPIRKISAVILAFALALFSVSAPAYRCSYGDFYCEMRVHLGLKKLSGYIYKKDGTYWGRFNEKGRIYRTLRDEYHGFFDDDGVYYQDVFCLYCSYKGKKLGKMDSEGVFRGKTWGNVKFRVDRRGIIYDGSGSEFGRISPKPPQGLHRKSWL